MIVTMALVAVVALQADPTDPNPKGTLALVFGIVGAFLVLMFLFQRLDLQRAERGGAEAPAAAGAVDDPASLDEPTLWATLAVRPIDEKAVRARRAVWSTARASQNLGMVVTLLIFLAVPPIYLLDTFVPLLIGAPLIVGIALWKSARLLAPGGELDSAYDTAGHAMAPLGLEITERIKVTIEPKGVAPFRMGTTLRGALEMRGRRHGRAVRVRMPATGGWRTKCEVHVACASPEFELRSRDGRLKAGEGAPAAVKQALERLSRSPRWDGVKGSAGAEGIAIERKGGQGGDWMLDLWLAERIAAATG